MNVSTEHVADMMLKEENKRVKGMEDTLGKIKLPAHFHVNWQKNFWSLKKKIYRF